MADTGELAIELAKHFIQRKDVKARQVSDGGYRPVREKWKMGDLKAHIDGVETFGHYTNDSDGMTKLVVFDIDLEKNGTWVELPSDEWIGENVFSDKDFFDAIKIHEDAHPREEWRDRRHPARKWYKQQLRTMVEIITSPIVNTYGMRSAAAYSGNKGCHVYAFFDEPTDIGMAREIALGVLEMAGAGTSSQYEFEATKGKNFFQYNDPDPYTGFKNLSIEIYPKQDTMEGKDFGNLVRLPGGINHKGPTYKVKGEVKHEPAFFIDQRAAVREIIPHPDPVTLLQTGRPYL
ncbi:DNA primase [Gordonia phage Hollow]|nr:DNA primase [Gordonia phage Hollow]